MAHSQPTGTNRIQASPGFSLAIGISVLGGAIAGVMIPILEVVKGNIEGNPAAGEAGIAIWVLPPLLALVGFPLGLVGRLVAVAMGLHVGGALRGAVFGMMLGTTCAALFLAAAAYDGGLDFSFVTPMIGLLVGYVIAGALGGIRFLKVGASP